MGWDESADRITFGTGTFTGASSGNLNDFRGKLYRCINNIIQTIVVAELQETYINQHQRTSSDGAVGDLWILYS